MSGSRATLRAALPAAVALLPALFLLGLLDTPLYEDGLFWWVPRALLLAQDGPAWIAAGDLPLACLPNAALPPQWTGGLPDYGHPPLWFHYLAAWVRILGPHAWVIHLACVPVALALGAGTVTLARRLAGPAGAVLAAAALLSPPLLAQLLRPDTDLPLLAASLWALVALIDRRPLHFALLSILAAWLKEPAALLVLPALVLGARERCPRLLAACTAAPLALVAWGLIHHQQVGWALAGAEHLPTGVGPYLRDLGAVLYLSLVSGGRWVTWLLLAAALVVSRQVGHRVGRAAPSPADPSPATRALLVCGVFATSQLLVFAGLNFLGGRGAQDAYTHVRYLLPAITTTTLLGLALALRHALASMPGLRSHPQRVALIMAAVVVAAALPTSRWLHPRGPEANLFGIDQARAWQRSVDLIEQHRPATGRVWVESHLYTALTRPYAGLVDRPMTGVVPFGPSTRPEEPEPGDLVVHSRYGEPLSRLAELVLEPRASATSGSAWVKLETVGVGRSATAPSPSK